MLGNIDIRDNIVWMPAGWVFDNVLELVTSRLQVEDVALSAILIEARTDTGGGLDLRTLDADRFCSLVRAVEHAHEGVVSRA